MSYVNTVLNDLKEWYGQGFDEALGRSLSRVMAASNQKSIGIISAHRAIDPTSSMTPQQQRERNNQAHKDMAKDIRQAGLGFTHIKGVGQEETGPSSEPSFLVGARTNGNDKGHLKGVLTKLGTKYGQMGILHKAHGDPNAKFVHTSKEHLGKEEDLGQFHANNSAAQYYSKLKGNRQFSFSKEGLDVVYLRPKDFFIRRDMLADDGG